MLWKTHRSWDVLVLKPNSWPLGAPGKELCPWEGPSDLMSSISRPVLSPGTFTTQRGWPEAFVLPKLSVNQ